MTTLTINLQSRPARTPKWASRTWTVWRGPYNVGEIRWDETIRQYKFSLRSDTAVAWLSWQELQQIAEFMAFETGKHITELTQRKRKRIGKVIAAMHHAVKKEPL